MKKLLLFASTLFTLTLHSQTWVWSAAATGGSSDKVSTCMDHNNNIISTGDWNGPSVSFSSQTLLNSSASSNNYETFVVKYNSGGLVLWVRNFGGKNADLPEAMAVDKWNNIYVTGNFNSDTLILK